MNVNELRMGSYVFGLDGLTHYVEGLSSNSVVTHGIAANSVSTHIDTQETTVRPIPLTLEWLVRFGFNKKLGLAQGIEVHVLEKLTIAKMGDRYIPAFLNHNDEISLIGSEVKFVHQLQNLYIALTGDELLI
ncbi:MAG: hypothetical protein AAGB30_11035 [Pedobacter sp.]|nr:hypothetical protein [Pedobacter sp.]